MKKRLLSILLVFCMVLSLLPLNAIAAYVEEQRELDEQLAYYMAELGLVDENGALIRDNSFTVEDGTHLASLDALLDWYDTCDEEDMDTLITVDATGRTATADWILQAIGVEAQIGMLSDGLNLLANADTPQTSASDIDVSGHGLYLVYFTEPVDRSGDIVSIKVGLTDDSSIKFIRDPERVPEVMIPAPHDIGLEIGIFASFFCGDLSPDGYYPRLPSFRNNFASYTLEAGERYIDFRMDMSKLRSQFMESTVDHNYDAFWGRGQDIQFQCRSVSGMPETSFNFDIYFADKEYHIEPDYLTGDYIVGLADLTTDTLVPITFDLSDSDVTEEVVDGVTYYRIATIPEFYTSKDDGEYALDHNVWFSILRDAYRAGAGDPDDFCLSIEHAAVIADVKRLECRVNDATLYVKGSDGKMRSISTNLDAIFQSKYEEDVAAIEQIVALLRGRWEYPDLSTLSPIEQFLWEQYCAQLLDDNNTATPVYYTDLSIPVNIHANYGEEALLPEAVYLRKDWLTKPGTNDESLNIKPGFFTLFGKFGLSEKVAPTVTSVTWPEYASFRPGDVIPITVTYSEPILNANDSTSALLYERVIQPAEGDNPPVMANGSLGAVRYFDSRTAWGSVTSDDAQYGLNDRNYREANTQTYKYTVQPGDHTVELSGLNVTASGKVGVTDIMGNPIKLTTGLDYVSLDDLDINTTISNIRSVCAQDTIQSITAQSASPTTATISVTLKTDDAFQNLWYNWNDTPTFTAEIVLNRDTENYSFPLQLTRDSNNNIMLTTSEITLPASTTARDFVAELYLDGEIYWGAYSTFTQPPVVVAPANAYTIQVDNGWPSGKDAVVYIQDRAMPTFTALQNAAADYTCKGDLSQLEWRSSDPEVLEIVPTGADITLEYSPQIRITPRRAGTATIELYANNYGIGETKAAAGITVTVKDDNTPVLLFPQGADTFIAQQDRSLTMTFASTVGKYAPASTDAEGVITAQLFEGATATGTALATYSLDRTATEITLPENLLHSVSSGDNPAYTLKLTATASYLNEDYSFEALAYILVRSKPAKIHLGDVGTGMFLSSEGIPISWSVDNLDTLNLSSCQFEFRVEKNGVVFGDSLITDINQALSGSYTLHPDTPVDLKEEYTVLIKAKNSTDPTWSYDSVILTVYRENSLDLLVGGKPVDSVTMKNEIEGSTTTNPTIHLYNDGSTRSGLTDAYAIGKLRSELSLLKSISVDCTDAQWDALYDMFAWETSTGQSSEAGELLQEIVTLNYLEGNSYSPLDSYPYLCYMPETVLLLSGIEDGTATVTAQHRKIPALTSSVEVNVERLKNKLYLFQFTPAVKTEVCYVDNNGQSHTVYSNDDGSMALYEPDGIQGDVYASSRYEGSVYRGTYTQLNIRSGEPNGITSALYPLNSVQLRKAAVAEFTLLKPDGSPLANETVTVRGGVYRNPDGAAFRDERYCPEARFTGKEGAPATLDGKTDMSFTTDSSGVLRIYMDNTQFQSSVDDTPLNTYDALRFIFELRFGNNAYNPEIVKLDASLTYTDTIRLGSNIFTLTAAKGVKPVVAEQTVNYTGRKINVRKHTGVVGPSPDYPFLILDSQVLLWGMNDVNLQDTSLCMDLRTQDSAFVVPYQYQQPVADASYPFSSIPLLGCSVEMDSGSFADLNGTLRTPVELAICTGEGTLLRTVALPFGLADVTSIPKLSTSQSVTSMMAKLALFGQAEYESAPDGSVDEKKQDNKVMKVAEELLDAMGLIEGIGTKLGLIRTILMPTEDPTKFAAYIWTGYDTTAMADLRYDANGIYKEPSNFVEDLEQSSFAGFTLADFQAMSDGTYLERLQTDNTSIATHIFGEGSTMQGWMTAEICYNFSKGEWQVVTTGGGFTYGKELEKAITKQRFKPILYNYGVALRGGLVITLETAIRYAEQLGEEWNDETARAVNDYLTALRISAYVELFAGIGIDKYGVALTISAFGGVEVNNVNRYLHRTYLKDSSKHKLKGHFVQLDGTFGLREKAGIGSLMYETTLISFTVGDQWRFKDWYTIDDYWKSASSGFSTGYLDPESTAPAALFSGELMFAESTSGVQVQSRDYLANDRAWLGENNLSLMSLQTGSDNRLAGLQTNAYPFSTPMISDDSGILIYMSDADSTDVEDVEIRYSLNNGGSFSDGDPIPAGADGFTGYGDTSPDFDGTRDFAGAVWLRQSAALDMSAGAEVSRDQQISLVSGLEVVASLWDGDSETWTTTRLTDNGTQEMSPIIAVNEDGKAIAVWRSVQTDWNKVDDDTLDLSFSENRVLFRIYDGHTWSDTYTLNNGSTGNIGGMSVELLGDTAAIAMTVDSTDYTTATSATGSEIYYAVVDITSASPEDAVKTVRATNNGYGDSNPQLTALADDELFVLGWYSIQDNAGVEQRDLGLRVFDRNGTPMSTLPTSLSNLVSTKSFDGKFAFVKGAYTLDDLSLLWNDANSGEENNDILRAVKFGKYGDSYSASAPIEVAVLPANTHLEYLDACTDSGMDVQAVLQAVTYDIEDTRKLPVSLDVEGTTYTGETEVPSETINLYSALEYYADSVAVTGTFVDFSTLATNSYTTVNFTVENRGLHTIRELTVEINGQTQTFSDLSLLPGRNQTVSVIIRTGNTIVDLPYTVTADFEDAYPLTDSGTLYLDYPDVGISSLRIMQEQDGERNFLATLYNQAAATLNRSDRRVVLGVYSDPDCETALDGGYFANGTPGEDYELLLSGDALSRIDDDIYAQSFTFHIGDYMADADKDEIPASGVMLFVRARIQQRIDGVWVDLPEADSQNNLKNLTFHSLLERSTDTVTTSVEVDNNGRTTTAQVTMQNNSLQANSSGYLLAALLAENGALLETQTLGNLTLGAEEQREIPITFSKSGARVVLRYGEPVTRDDSNANVKSISLEGYPLSLADFDEESHHVVYALALGQYLLTVIPEDAGATVYVNHEKTEKGMFSLDVVRGDEIFVITVISADGTARSTYVLALPEMTPAVGPVKPDTPDTPDTPENPFVDVFETDWFYEDVLYAYTNALMNGTGDSTFSPNVITTRGMIVTVLYRLAGAPAVSGTCPFTDVKAGSYCEKAICWAAENGIVNGYGNGLYGPDDLITREQMATILYRYAQYQGLDVSMGEDTNILSYTDISELSQYAMPAMQWTCSAGIINGTSESTLSPKGSASRAQIAAILHRFCELFLKK